MSNTVYRGLVIRKHADRSEGRRVPLLRVPASAVHIDESTGVVHVNPAAGTRILHNPDTPGLDHEAWPSAGVELVKKPKNARLPTGFVANARSEGWATIEGERVVHRSGGPPEDPWRVTHSFMHADAIVFHTVDGDVRYRVVEQPDKWPDGKEGDAGFGGDVRWHYDATLEA